MTPLAVTPFVLKGRKRLPPDIEPSDRQTYDDRLQIWIDRESGLPAVICAQMQTLPSPFGETTLTETREGADQSEIADLRASQFGETTMTKTREGTDQVEGAMLLETKFGETTLTATVEGADQSEIASLQASTFGETTLTRTIEGADQREAIPESESMLPINTASVLLDAPHSHL